MSMHRNGYYRNDKELSSFLPTWQCLPWGTSANFDKNLIGG